MHLRKLSLFTRSRVTKIVIEVFKTQRQWSIVPSRERERKSSCVWVSAPSFSWPWVILVRQYTEHHSWLVISERSQSIVFILMAAESDIRVWSHTQYYVGLSISVAGVFLAISSPEGSLHPHIYSWPLLFVVI